MFASYVRAGFINMLYIVYFNLPRDDNKARWFVSSRRAIDVYHGKKIGRVFFCPVPGV